MTVNFRTLASRGRGRIPTGLAALALTLVGTAVACAPAGPLSGPSVSPTARLTETPGTATVVAALSTPTTGSPIALARTRATALARARTTPRRMATPRPRYTPTPAPTPLPPSEALAPTANGLLAKLTALRTAMKGHDVATTLKAQRQLLAAADVAVTTLKEDHSYQASLVRQAVSDLHAGAVGDNNGLDHAEASLNQAIGGYETAGLGISVEGGRATPTDPTQALQSLSDEVQQLGKAVHDGNVNDALKLQGLVLTNLTTAQEFAKQDDSEKGKALQKALADVSKALDSDPAELAAVSTALAGLVAPNEVATTSVKTEAQSLEMKLDAFRAALSTNDRATLFRLQPALLAEANQAEQGLSHDPTEDGASLKNAIGDIRAGAGGDLAKLDAARASLGHILGETPAEHGAPSAADLPKLAGDLDDKVQAFQAAMQKNDTGAMLHNQEELNAEMDQVDPQLKTVQVKSAEQLRGAIGAIRAAFGGDMSKMNDAHTMLVAIAGTGAQPGGAAEPGTAMANGTPTSAEAPMPGNADTAAMAKSLAAKVDAFRLAATANDRADLLRLQPDLLAEADQDAAALQADTSAQGKAMKEAIDGIRDGTAGDFSKLDGARTALGTVLGEKPQASSHEATTNMTELGTDLENKVHAFQQALQTNDTGTMLRLQRDLTAEMAKADPQLQAINSQQADMLRGAMAATRAAFAGDTSKLDEALADVQAAKGEVGTTAAGTLKPATAPVDFHGPSGELRNKLNQLQAAVNSHQPEKDVAQRREDLKAVVSQAEDAMHGATGAQAEKMSNALNAAHEAAAGDDAKVDTAMNLLSEALNEHPTEHPTTEHPTTEHPTTEHPNEHP